MTEKARKYLSDILLAIDLIQRFISDTPDFPAYQLDLKTQSAVERQLGIVGEAVNQLRLMDDGLILQQANQIVGFRNRIIHAYDNLDDTVIWAIIQLHLPALKAEVETLT